jgi:hypothetical protein
VGSFWSDNKISFHCHFSLDFVFPQIASISWVHVRGLEDASTDIYRENSPVSGIDAASQSSLNSPVSATGQVASSRDMPVPEPGTPIEIICRRFQTTDNQIRSARFQTAARSLLRMVLNYKSMSHILLRLGLQERDTPFVPLQTVTLPGGLVVSAGEVVGHFGWTMESFKRKAVWYGWAERAASSQEWNEPTPSELFQSLNHIGVHCLLCNFDFVTYSRWS